MLRRGRRAYGLFLDVWGPVGEEAARVGAFRTPDPAVISPAFSPG